MDKTKCFFAANDFRVTPINALFVLAIATLMMVTGSCRKVSVPEAGNAQSRADSKKGIISEGLSDERIDAMVTQFYDHMKTLQHETASPDNISLEEAVLDMEAVYNKYVVVTDYLGDVATGELSVRLPVRKDGAVNMKEVANVFWAVKENLLKKQSDLTEDNVVPKLETFDLEAVADAEGNHMQRDGYYTIKAQFAFARPNGGGTSFEQKKNIFTEAATHCWRAPGATDGSWQSSGQGTIDHANMTILLSSIDLTKPSAPSALRTKGIYNYRDAYGQNATGYAYNITTVGGNANTNIMFPIMSAVNCDYVNRGIADYTNIRWWNTKKYDANYADPFVIYKEWLTTPMMNYYVAAIKEVINLNIAPAKYFYNLHVITNTASGGPQAFYWFHEYFVSSCRYIRFIPEMLSLYQL